MWKLKKKNKQKEELSCMTVKLLFPADEILCAENYLVFIRDTRYFWET